MSNPVNADQVGLWSDEFSWPMIGIHAVLTPDGKVLTFGTDQDGSQSGLHIYDVWDPATNTHTTLEHHTHSDIFCSAAVIVPDTGQVLISGGDARPLGAVNSGVPDVTVFDPTSETLTHSPTGSMEFSRWYGTAVTLGNGQIVMLGGLDDQGTTSTGATYSAYPEIYTPGYGFRTLTGAYIDSFNNGALYPRSWLSSSGKIIAAADGSSNIYAIDPSGSGSVSLVGTEPAVFSWNMPEVMFAPDKVLLVAADGTAWVMDISGAQPVFTQTDSIGADRIWSNLTVLPDGRVMISGGSAVDDELTGVNESVEIWNPATGQWTIESSAAVPRLYHSTALLLPDATVLNLGGGAPGPLTNTNGQIFHPDYLYGASGADAVRPLIDSAPHEAEVGDQFIIHVTDTQAITTLALLPFGSVTHSINMDAQRIALAFQDEGNGNLLVTLPANANVLTPGYWMLFAIDQKGTPSVASTLKVDSEVPKYQPAQLPLELGFRVTINGDAAYDGFDDSYALVPDAATKHGSVFADSRIDLSHHFDLTFEINLGTSNTNGGGVAFVLENDAAGAAALGTTGAGLGESGIGNGLAIRFGELDPKSPGNDSTDIVNTATGAVISPAVSLGDIADGAWHTVHLTWNGTRLSYSLDGIHEGVLTGNLASYLGGAHDAYFGFTGGSTNAVLEKVRIDNIDTTLESGASVAVDRAGLPTPPSFVANGDASYDSTLNKYAFAPGSAGQDGSVMTGERIDLSQSFNYSFEFRLGSQDVAGSGLAFVLHDDPLGSHALGSPAGALGALGIADGLGITFDTSGSDKSGVDHSGFVATSDGSAQSASSAIANIADEQWHTVRVAWDASAHALSYWLDGTEIGTLNADVANTYLGGSKLAYLGVTGVDSGAGALAETRMLRLDATAAGGGKLHVVGPNATPIASDDSYAVAVNGKLTVAAAAGVLANDSDPDGDPLTICTDSHLIPHSQLLAPANGTVSMNPDGSFTYIPRPGFVGVDQFTYCNEDFANACASATVSVTVGKADLLPGFVANGSAAAESAANTYTLTPDALGQVGSVMSTSKLDLSKAFTLTFEINLGDKPNGADGAAFVLHDDPSGSQALGSGGNAFGAGGLANSLAIAFDTHYDPQLADDHSAFIDNQTEALSPTVDLGNVKDGHWHNVVVTWDGKALSYRFDGVNVASIAASTVASCLGGAAQTYFGFTGATGGNSSQLEVNLLSLATAAVSTVTVAAYLQAGSYPGNDVVILADSGANIAALNASQIGSLAANGIDRLYATDGGLSLTVADYLGLGSVALTPGNLVTLADTGAHIASLSSAEIAMLARNGVARLDATDGALSLDVAGYRALGAVAFTPGNLVTIADTGAALASLSAAELAGKGIGRLDAIDGAFSLDVAEYRALGSIDFTQRSHATVADTGANIASLSPTEFATLAGKGIARLDASDGALSLSVADCRALGSVTLVHGDLVTIADTGRHLAGLSAAEVAGLAGKGVSTLDANNGALTLSLAQYRALGSVAVSPSDVLTIKGTPQGDVIRASDGRDRIDGGGGNDAIYAATDDTLTGGPGADRFVFSIDPSHSATRDHITDFSPSDGDRIVLGLAAISAGSTGLHHHHAIDFRTKPPPASDHHASIVYSHSTGLLIYESHGAVGAAVRVAVLDNHPLLTAADLIIIG